MTQWGLDTLFNPAKRHMDEEKRRLQSTREQIGDSSGGKRIDLESGKVTIRREAKDGEETDEPGEAAEPGEPTEPVEPAAETESEQEHAETAADRAKARRARQRAAARNAADAASND